MPAPAIKALLAACLIVFLFYHPANGPDEPHTLEGPWRQAFLYADVYVLYAASTRGIHTPLQWRGFTRLSRYSFGIVILHPAVGMVFFKAAPERWGEATAGAVPLIAAGVLASVLTAIASYHLFENPVHRWLVKRIDAWVSRSEGSSGFSGST